MKKIVITRLVAQEKQTLGHLSLYDGTKVEFEAKTLELPWKDNWQNVSCIPPGLYRIEARYSHRFGHHLRAGEQTDAG